MKCLTNQQVKEACKKHKYLLFRNYNNYVIGINSKMAEIAIRIKKPDMSGESTYISYTPCSFNEYINYKHPFV